MDIYKAKQAFLHYVESYDIEDEQIRLKVVHTMKVCENSQRIAKAMNLSKEDQELAYIIGLLHDIGRFEQIRIYHTFLDAKSEDHAQLGIRILQENQFIRSFLESDAYDSIVYSAIRNHNKFQIEDGLDERVLLHTLLIRDSDKTDIFRVDCFETAELLFLCTQEELQRCFITKEVYEAVAQEHTILAAKRKTKLDVFISHLALIFDFNYKESLSLVKQQGYFETLLRRFVFEDRKTQQQYVELKQKMRKYISNRICE